MHPSHPYWVLAVGLAEIAQMSTGQVSLLLGLFAVPAVLLWLSERLHRRPLVVRGAFWGALIGHSMAMVVAIIAAMYTPVVWTEADVIRGVLAWGSMPLAGVIGAGVGAWMAHARARVAHARPDSRIQGST